jgi:hypothetical protein
MDEVMKPQWKRWSQCASCIIAMSAMSALAHLSETVIDGVRVEARAIYVSGDARDLDCTLSVLLTGDELTRASQLSPVRNLRVLDDTGASLVRTNRRGTFTGDEALPSRTDDVEWLMLGRTQAVFSVPIYFRKPSEKAKSLQLVEWEMDVKSSNAAPRLLKLRLENIRLPWVDPPRMQTIATLVRKEEAGGNFTRYRVRLTFAGGPVPGSFGMRDLRIHKAETDDGRVVTISRPRHTPPEQFSFMHDFAGKGRTIERDVVMTVPTEAKSVRILSAEADLFFPTASTGSRVEFDTFLGSTGQSLESPSFASHGIAVKFLGHESFESRRKIDPTNRVRMITVLPSPPLPERTPDSLLFSITDPELRVCDFSFHDGRGRLLPILTRTTEIAPFSPRSNRWFLYTFKEPPPVDTSVIIPVMTAESLERIPFAIECLMLR